MTKNKKLVEEIFKPCNETFISEWKKWDELEDSKLTFKRGNGNSHRGGVWWGVNKYQWETEYVGGSVERIRIIGLSNKEKQGRPIRKEIRETLLKKYKGCIHCGNHKSLCIDHKNDMYNDKRVLCENLQKIEDFQVLCNKCNKDLKHQINVKEKKTGKLHRVKELNIIPYINDKFNYPWELGITNYDEKKIYCKMYTYWYDPEDFHRKRDIYINTRSLNRSIKNKIKLIL